MTLDERIANAFRDGTKSETVVALIADVETASAEATTAAEAARERALDPTTADTAAARRQMDDAAFARDRLSVALPRLQAQLKALRATEENARWVVAYNKAQDERDKLAAELKDVYPALAAKFTDVVARMAANDRQLDIANDHQRPTGAEKLRSAEEVARNRLRGANIASIPKELRLPSWLPELSRGLRTA